MPNNFNYDGFQGINSVAIRSGDRCQIYNHDILEYRNETDIYGLRWSITSDFVLRKKMYIYLDAIWT